MLRNHLHSIHTGNCINLIHTPISKAINAVVCVCLLSSHMVSIHPNLRYSVYCQAVALGGEEEWAFAWRMFQNATSATEKDKLRYALSCTRKIWLLNRYTPEGLDSSYTPYMHSSYSQPGPLVCFQMWVGHLILTPQDVAGKKVKVEGINV